MQPLRIVHIFSYGFGGGFVMHQVLALKSRGHIIAVVCPEEGTFSASLRSQDIDVVVFPFLGYRPVDLPRVARAIWQLRRWLRATQPDVVHYHLIKGILIGRIAGLMARVPVRVSQLGGPLPLEIPVLRTLDLATAWIDTRILASSRVIASHYGRWPWTRQKVVLNYYGFPFEPFLAPITKTEARTQLGVAPEARLVLMAAYMYPSRLARFRSVGIKGHEVLLQAAAHIQAIAPDVQFLIAGDELAGSGEYRRHLESMARELGVEQTVSFLGHREDIPRLLAAADVVAVPSLSENVGGAVEPLLMARPVVASNVGGLLDVVEDGVTGRLVPPGDSQALAAALLDVLRLSEAERLRLGQEGKMRVMDLFDPKKCIDVLEETYYAARGRKRL